MKRFLLIVTVALLAVSAAQAQPSKRRTTTSTAAAQRQNTQKQGSDRASLLFPTSDAMPEDVVWRRDIYRQLDLNKDGNAPLYYPVEPVGTQCNLFTYIFRLVLSGRVTAYKYNLDGNESFAEKNKITDLAGDLLNRYYIYYEENNGKYTVADNDVPSAQVLRYYVKESVYLDQRTGTTRTKVVALCPILMEDGFGSDEDGAVMASPKPLFWLNYEEVAPYLSKLPVMASNYNNVTNMTADDFFTMNRYDGKIYKTSNMQGKLLQDYCKTDSALVTEQKRIEKQLTDFEAGIWTHKEKVDSLDSIPAPEATKASKKAAKTKTTSKNDATAVKSGSTSATRRSSSTSSSSKSKSSSSSSKSAPAASARRTRR